MSSNEMHYMMKNYTLSKCLLINRRCPLINIVTASPQMRTSKIFRTRNFLKHFPQISNMITKKNMFFPI